MNWQRQDGAILICALAAIAVMSATALLALDRMRLAVRAAAHMEAASQTRNYAEAAIAATAEQMNRARHNGNIRNFYQKALQAPLTLPFADGTVELSFGDGANCFNLNALSTEKPDDLLLAKSIFEALLRGVEIEPEVIDHFVPALIDWMDKDNLPRRGGAEDLYYISLSLPYRTSGQQLADLSELHRIAGFAQEITARLGRLLCVRPDHLLRPLNLDTLRVEQARLLSAVWGEELTPEMAETLIAQRPSGGYAQLDDFFALPQLAGKGKLDEKRRGLLVLGSRWLDMEMTVRVQSAELVMAASLAIGDDNKIVEISRRFGAQT